MSRSDRTVAVANVERPLALFAESSVMAPLGALSEGSEKGPGGGTVLIVVLQGEKP